MAIKKIIYNLDLGRYQVWYSRLASYISSINFVMIMYLYVASNPMGIIWYYWVIFIIIAVVFILFIDIIFVLPSSQQYSFNKNPEFVELREQIKKLHEKIDEIKLKL